MRKEFYDKLYEPYRRDEKKCRRLETANTVITRCCYILYPAVLVWLAVMRDERFWKVLLVPLCGFAAVSLFRKAVNAARPYEVFHSAPLIPKDTKGKSFPSRHVFSIFMIAMTIGYLWLPGGVLLLCAGVVLAWIRVVSGVHFVRDVAAGALIAVGIGLIEYYCF